MKKKLIFIKQGAIIENIYIVVEGVILESTENKKFKKRCQIGTIIGLKNTFTSSISSTGNYYLLNKLNIFLKRTESRRICSFRRNSLRFFQE